MVQGLLVGPVVSRLGERRTLPLGLLCGAAGFAIYGLAPTGPLFLVGVPVMSLWGMSGPAMLQMMSRLVSPSEQGQLYGANSSLASVAALIGPALFTGAFAAARPRAGRGVRPGGPDPRSRLGRRRLDYTEAASRRPASVSLQTSQSGFSGLLNQGSAQPLSRQACTTSGAIAWPSRSNSGSLPPAWVKPRRR